MIHRNLANSSHCWHALVPLRRPQIGAHLASVAAEPVSQLESPSCRTNKDVHIKLYNLTVTVPATPCDALCMIHTTPNRPFHLTCPCGHAFTRPGLKVSEVSGKSSELDRSCRSKFKFRSAISLPTPLNIRPLFHFAPLRESPLKS